MSDRSFRPPLQNGAAAPVFSLPAVSREGTVGLADYKGRSALLLGMFRGLYCPFCRRQLAIFSEAANRIRSLNIEALAVITTPGERARAYFRHRPASMLIASDPEMTTHRAYGVPQPQRTTAQTDWPATLNSADVTALQSDHAWPDVSVPISLAAAADQLDKKDGYDKSAADLDEEKATWRQLGGLILIDKAGIIRWTDFEATGGLKTFGNIAGVPAIVAAAERLDPPL
jgi:peroxiredoxin